MRPFYKSGQDPKGFTIIELIVVIAIIGILAVMAVPRMMSTTTISARESAELVAADIRKTQEMALADTASHSITFTSGSGNYVIDQGTASAQTISLPSGVTISTTATITFNVRGEPNAAATINVGGTSVVVTQYTGKVTVS